MTEQEINNRIALALGWIDVSSWSEPNELEVIEWCGWKCNEDGSMEWSPIPKYCADLNAIRHAESILLKSIEAKQHYTDLLSKNLEYVVLADAKQKASALLSVISNNN